MHINVLKTSDQAEIEIRMIEATYIVLIGKKQEKKTCHYMLSFSSWPPTWSNKS